MHTYLGNTGTEPAAANKLARCATIAEPARLNLTIESTDQDALLSEHLLALVRLLARQSSRQWLASVTGEQELAA